MDSGTTALVPFRPGAASSGVPSARDHGIQTASVTSTFTKGVKIMIDNPREIMAFGEGNLQALTAASKIWVAGMQDLTKQVATTARASFEETVATAKAMATARSVKEAIDLQSSYTKNAVVNSLAEASKLTEASLRLSEQALVPLTARIADAVGVLARAA